MASNEKLLTIAQAAQQLGVSIPTLRKWADEGQIPVVKLPSGYRRFQPDEIQRKRRELGFTDRETDASGQSS